VKRTYLLLVVVLFVALTISATEGEVPMAHAFSLRSVYLRKTKLGKILVNTAGAQRYLSSPRILRRRTPGPTP